MTATSSEEQCVASRDELPDFFAACPLCGGDACHPFVAHPGLEFVCCDACSLVFKQRAARSLLADDSYAPDFFTSRRRSYDLRFERRVRRASAEIMECRRLGWQGTKGDVLLDIGCSYGYVLEAAKQQALRGVGIDVSPHAVEVCTQRGYEASAASMEELPFARESISLVFAKHVFEHSTAPSKALEEVHRVLAPGGWLYLAVPDLAYWKAQLAPARFHYFLPNRAGRYHHAYYSQATLGRIITMNGFRVVQWISELPQPLARLSDWLHLRHNLVLVAQSIG